MSFESQEFLYGLSLLIIPILLTFLIRKKINLVSFPTIRFLKLVSRNKLRVEFVPRSYLLLLIRLLAFICLCLIFASPVLIQKEKNRVIKKIMLMDDSLSMQRDNTYARCQSALVDFIQKSASNYQFSIFFASGKHLSFNQKRSDIVKSIQTHKVTNASLNHLNFMKKITAVLSNSEEINSVVFFTDLQTNGWKAKGYTPPFDLTLPLTIVDCSKLLSEEVLISLKRGEIPWLKREDGVLHVPLEFINLDKNPVKIEAKISKIGGQNNQVLYKGNEELKGRGIKQKEIIIRIKEKVDSLAALAEISSSNSVKGYELAHQRFFVMRPKAEVQVVIIDGSEAVSLFNNQTYYLQQALTLIPWVKVRQYSQTQFVLSGQKVEGLLILLNPNLKDGKFRDIILDYWRKGGFIWLSVGDHYDSKTLGQLWQNLGLLQGSFQQPKKAQDWVISIEKNHAFFKINKHITVNDFRTTKIQKVVPVINEGKANLILKANQLPLLLEWKESKDRILFLFTNSFDNNWGSFSIKPIFPVFWEGVLSYYIYNAGKSKQNNHFIISDSSSLAGDMEFSDGLIKTGSYYHSKPGIYSKKSTGFQQWSGSKASIPEVFALNVDVEEFFSGKIEDDFLLAIFPKSDLSIIPYSKLKDEQSLKALRGGDGKKQDLKPLLWYILFALLLLETIYFIIKSIKKEKQVLWVLVILFFFFQDGKLFTSPFKIKFLYPQDYARMNVELQNKIGMSWFFHELTKRTSIDSNIGIEVVKISSGIETLFQTPFLYFEGRKEFKGFNEQERKALRLFVLAGGTLLIDDVTPPDDLEMSFNSVIRRELKNLFSKRDFIVFPLDHAIYRSFYLLRTAVGLYAAFPRLEGIDIEGQPAVIYSRNNVFGAFNRSKKCVPEGERQREYALRLGINLILYSLTSDYKKDQIHLPEILKRTR